MQLKWKNPPQVKQNEVRWADVAAELNKRPGVWAFVGNRSYASMYTTAAKYNLECTVRNIKGYKGDVYLRVAVQN